MLCLFFFEKKKACPCYSIKNQRVSHPGFDPVALDVYDDVYIVNDHGVELKDKAPPLIGYAMFWI